MKVLGEKEKTVTLDIGDKEAHNSARGHDEKQEENDKGEKGKSIVLVKSDRPTVLVSFVQAVMDVHISYQFIPPQFKMYDGTTDPKRISSLSLTLWLSVPDATPFGVGGSPCPSKGKLWNGSMHFRTVPSEISKV